MRMTVLVSWVKIKCSGMQFCVEDNHNYSQYNAAYVVNRLVRTARVSQKIVVGFQISER